MKRKPHKDRSEEVVIPNLIKKTIKKGKRGKFVSRYHLKCIICKSEFVYKKFPYNATRGTIEGKYCSKECRYYDHSNRFSGKNHPRWNGGKYIDDHGYIKIYCPEREGKYTHVGEHILVMEKNIGRRIKKGEVVHHINGNKQDNRIENLEIKIIAKHLKDHGFYDNKKTGNYLNCNTCKKKVYRKKHQLKNKNHFCSKECFHKWQKGKHFSPETEFKKSK